MFKNLFIRIARLFGYYPKVWLWSDPHFGHKNIISYCSRPFDNVNQMDDELIRRYNSVVRKQDKVYMLGDIGFKNAKRTVALLEKLNGEKYLVFGNHDGQLVNYIARKDIKIFKWIRKTHRLDYFDGKRAHEIYLSHYPTSQIESADFLIYGHTHQRFANVPVKSVCVCVEHWDYFPVSIDEVINAVG